MVLHYGEKAVVIPSYLYNGNPYASQTASLHWNGLRSPELKFCRPPLAASQQDNPMLLMTQTLTASKIVGDNTPNLTLMDELWGVHAKDFG